jgi:flagellar hook-associated protein 1 FlgK
MAIGLLGTAASGLQVFQRALSVTGHNINNANTDGYTRQRVELGTKPATFTGAGFIGNGVQIESIRRIFDQFAIDHLRDTTSTSKQYDTLAQFSERISNLMGDSKAGLSAGLESFFSAVQGVSNDPSSVPPRQVMLSEADSLVARFQYLNGQLGSIRDELNGDVGNMVNEINGLSSAIADTNRAIVDATGQGGREVPNDLLDKRDNLLNKLSELVSVRTVPQDDGSLNVFIGSGQSLVTGFLASPLKVVPNDFDARRADVGIVTAGATSVITSSITGGKLGALLDVRSQVLDPAQNALGRVATTLAVDFNAQHQLGMDLNGAMGGDFFAVGSPTVAPSARNAGSATVSATYDTANIANLTTQDYQLTFDGAAWVLTHASDGQVVPMSGAGTAASPFLADGMSIVVSGGAVAGDHYLIKPTRDAAAGTGVLIGDPTEVAAAAPVRITEAANASGLPTNTGDGVLQFQSVDSTFSQLSGGITLTYDALAQQFNYAGDATGSFAYNPATDSGSTFTVAGVSFRVTGAPATGDSFSLADNNAGSGDNANALSLAALQTAHTMEGGKTSFQGAYGQLIGKLGTQTRSAQVTSQAQTSLLAQAQQTRDAVSGVNLDEEAANLVRYQQAYQAIAQVISVADQTFQTLMSALGR